MFDLCMETPFAISKADSKRETSDKPKLKGIMQNVEPVSLKIVKVIKKKANLKNDHSLRTLSG